MKKKPFQTPCILATVALAGYSSQLFAQTPIGWDGDTDDDYTTGTNWVGDIAPADNLTTNIAQFNGGTVKLNSNRSVAGLDFNSGSAFDFNDTPGVVFNLGAAGIEVNGNSDIFGGELQFNQDITVTLAGGRLSTRNSVLSGTGKLSVTGGNTLFVDGASNTYSGGTSVSGGANFAFKGLGSFGSGNITLDNGKISGNGTPNLVFGSRIVTLDAGGGTMTTSGGRWSFTSVNGITGTGGLTVDGGNNNIFFDSANDFSGALTIKGTGRVGAKGAATLGDGSGTNNIFLEDGGTLFSNGSSVDTGSRVINLVGTGGELATNGARIGVGGIVTGSGALTVGSGNNTVFLDNAGNDYSGGTIVQGLVRPKSDAALGASNGAVTMQGGTLQGNAGNITFNADREFIIDTGGTFVANGANVIEGVVSGAGEMTIGASGGSWELAGTNTHTGDINLADASSKLKVSGSLGSGSYAGEISGDGTFEYAGTGSQTLTGSNTYTGQTLVSSGTFIVNGSLSTSSQVNVSSGATIGGSGTVGSLTVAAGAFHNPGNSPGIMNTGNYTLAGTLVAEITGTAPGASGHDQVIVNGTVDLTGGDLVAAFSGTGYIDGDMIAIILNDGADAVIGTFNGLTEGSVVAVHDQLEWQISYAGGDGNDVVLTGFLIPEPSAVSLLMGGLLVIALRRRR